MTVSGLDSEHGSVSTEVIKVMAPTSKSSLWLWVIPEFHGEVMLRVTETRGRRLVSEKLAVSTLGTDGQHRRVTGLDTPMAKTTAPNAASDDELRTVVTGQDTAHCCCYCFPEP